MEIKWISHRSVLMKYIFKKLFYNSIDLAAKFTTMKSKLEMENALKLDLQKTMQNWSNIGDESSSEKQLKVIPFNAILSWDVE